MVLEYLRKRELLKVQKRLVKARQRWIDKAVFNSDIGNTRLERICLIQASKLLNVLEEVNEELSWR